MIDMSTVVLESKSEPLISIIVPVFNVKNYLVKCLHSIINQSYSNIEVLAIDDGSTDGSAEICDQFSELDQRVITLHQTNKGVSAARNLGVQKSSGSFIMFVDSDDWVSQDIVQTLLHTLRIENADIVACESYHVRGNKKDRPNESGKVFSLDRFEALDLLIKDRAFRSRLWGRLYKVDVWKNVFFPEGETYEDVSTLYRTYLNANHFSFLEKALYYYNQREGSIVHPDDYKSLFSLLNARRSRYKILSKTYPELNENLKASVIAAGIDILKKSASGNVYLEAAEMNEVRQVFTIYKSSKTLKNLSPSYRLSFLLYRINGRLFHLLSPKIDRIIVKLRNRVN
ncbi:hypothetical protein A3778_13600 [Lacticaseibacillus paracasei]|nr:hypothetical protein A3778_13600 [Lacticaseibacillus paracasei]